MTGAGFSAASKVLWDGDARPTSFVSATTLRAPIAAADLSGAGNVPVGVSESTLPAASFRVVAQVARVHVPLARR